ncbi:MAG: DNA-binding protein [Cephaloticoccus sp.]|nr:DNA-binding protein [Cephaloticoccus sp.]MCF7759225.1 DNA-binding protein [Cephaloticoccus sp.]
MKNATALPSDQITGYVVAGKPVTCPHCGGVRFHDRKTLMNTRGATFFNLDWLNRAAFTLTCSTCSRIEWFGREPTPGQ